MCEELLGKKVTMNNNYYNNNRNKKSQDEKITKKDKRHCTPKELFL